LAAANPDPRPVVAAPVCAYSRAMQHVIVSACVAAAAIGLLHLHLLRPARS
jgi:hypothetical protein